MTAADRHILEAFAARVRARYPVARIWAFGSRARGEATWASDLDICVVLPTAPSRADKDWIGEAAWHAGYEADCLLTTVVFSREAFEEGPQSLSPLVAAVRREGVAA